MRRSPWMPFKVTSAISASATGALSDEDTAQQRGELRATRQMSPSFFRQKPTALRHACVWL